MWFIIESVFKSRAGYDGARMVSGLFSSLLRFRKMQKKLKKTTSFEEKGKKMGDTQQNTEGERPLMTSHVFCLFLTYLPTSHFVPFRKSCPFYDIPFA